MWISEGLHCAIDGCEFQLRPYTSKTAVCLTATSNWSMFLPVETNLETKIETIRYESRTAENVENNGLQSKMKYEGKNCVTCFNLLIELFSEKV